MFYSALFTDKSDISHKLEFHTFWWRSSWIYVLLWTTMQEFKIQHSLKNIPISNRHDYMLSLLNKIETFLARMSWRALSVLWNTEISQFKIRKSPHCSWRASWFWEKLIGILDRISLKKYKSTFQKKNCESKGNKKKWNKF